MARAERYTFRGKCGILVTPLQQQPSHYHIHLDCARAVEPNFVPFVGTRPHLMSRMLQGCCKDGQEVIKTRNMNRRTGRAIAGRARTDITLYGQCADQIISSNRIEFCVMVMGPGSQYLSWSLAWLKLVTSCLRYSELH